VNCNANIILIVLLITPKSSKKPYNGLRSLNTAYETLNNPVKRASYLLELAAHPISLNTSIADTDFLMSQLELREQMDEANTYEQLVGFTFRSRRVATEFSA
jgi:molecular chaperone HscB